MKETQEGFFQRVYEVVRKVPYGRITTYGAIAKYLGTGRSARMVGWAMNSAHNLEDVPAHRVVNRIGVLTGKHHFPGSRLMEQLLENEGIEIRDDQVVEFKVLFWDPARELPEA
jgi:methylated-DNA-protein-cysteine methyltransferase-like protein